MEPKVRRVIIESIDKALSSFNYVDKDFFYRTLEAEYGVKKEEIPEKYEAFHGAMIKIYGLKHHPIERRIVKVLHTSSQKGTYKEIDEIPAFVVIVESYLEEADNALEKSRAKLKENEAELKKLQGKTNLK